MDNDRTSSCCFTSPENLGESTSSLLYAVPFSAFYEGQSFELERYKATILYEVSLNSLQFLTSLTLEDMRDTDCRKGETYVLLLNSISCCHCLGQNTGVDLGQ